VLRLDAGLGLDAGLNLGGELCRLPGGCRAAELCWSEPAGGRGGVVAGALHGRRVGSIFNGRMVAVTRRRSRVMRTGNRRTLASLAAGFRVGGPGALRALRLLHGQRAVHALSSAERGGRRPRADHRGDGEDAGADVVKTGERLPRRGQRLLHGGRPRDRQSSFRLQVPQRAAGVANGVRKEYRSLQLNTNGQRSCRMAGKCAGSFAIH